MRVRPIALALTALAVACARTSDPTSDPTSGPTGGPGPVGGGPSATVPRATSLGGVPVSEEASGAWSYRRAVSPQTAAAAGAVREAKSADGRADGAERLEADGPLLGAPAPAASPAPPGAKASGPGRSGGVRGAPASGAAGASKVAADASGGGVRGPTHTAGTPLHAGATDDNADFPKFLAFLDTWTKRPDVAGRFQPLDVRGRRFVRVLDASGRPVPSARVTVLDEAADRLVADGTTYGDGRTPVYPRLGAKDGALPGALVVDVRRGDATVRARWDLGGSGDDFTVTLGTDVPPPDPVPLDVAFVIDTTGSMGDEIASIQACLLSVTAKIRNLARESDLRYATVLYRDVGDEYLTASHPFTADVDALERALREVSAGGGGDGPESLNQGLAETALGLEWRPGAAKVAFLIADAPPHMDYAGDTPYGDTCRAAVAKGLRIHTVAASGLDDVGTLVFRQVAQMTRGKFVFLQYGVPASGEDAARHGVAGAVRNDNLEDILFEQIRDEVAHFGR